ncbi:MAG: hypothetical protein AB1716_05385 [Planctomycetota bacterium]
MKPMLMRLTLVPLRRAAAREGPARVPSARVLRLTPLLLVAGLLLLSAGMSAGCKALVLLTGDPDREIKAEYPYLGGKTVCLLVRTDLETESAYPFVRYELADHVRVELESKIARVKVVDPRKVTDFQRGEPNWETMDPADLGKRFGADRVIEIDVTQYTTREPESEYLYRAHIAAGVRVYYTEYPKSLPTYKTEVRVAYPETGAQWALEEAAVRQACMELFAVKVAGKFYDHKVRAG